MFKAISWTAVGLLVTGIGLTLYLPPSSVTLQSNATVVTDSMKAPIEMVNLQRSLLTKDDERQGLLIGMYGEFNQARDVVQQIPQGADISLVKATNEQNIWFLLISGPFHSEQQGRELSKIINQRRQFNLKRIRWPLPQENKDETQTTP